MVLDEILRVLDIVRRRGRLRLQQRVGQVMLVAEQEARHQHLLEALARGIHEMNHGIRVAHFGFRIMK